MRKRCFVIPKISVKNKDRPEKLFRNSNDLSKEDNCLENAGFLLFYNFQKPSTRGGINFTDDTSTNGKKISGFVPLYNGEGMQPENLAGGSKKKKMIGGDYNNLFNITSVPFLSLKREKYDYDQENFNECLQKLRNSYKSSDFKKKIGDFQDIIDDIIYNYNYESRPILFPVVYSHGEDFKLGSFQLTYAQLRLIFHFSCVYTTFIKLLLFFFRNLIKIYQTLIYYFEDKVKNETTNKSTQLYEQKTQFYEENIKKFNTLISEIVKLIKILDLTISCGEDQINNFFGFNTIFYKNFTTENDSQNKIDKARQMQKQFINSIIDILFDGFTGTLTKISINPNQFMKLLQNISGIFPINFGGVPLIDLPKTQNSFLVSYSYFIKFRYVCQRNFSQFKKFYNIAERQKLTNKEITNISTAVNKEVEVIIRNKSPNLKDKCKNIFKKVLEKFMNTVIDIYPKKTSQASATSVHSNDSSDKQNLSKTVTEFKVYIAIMEKILENLIKAEFESAKTFIDPNTLFLFMMGRFNNFIYLLESCLIDIRVIKEHLSDFLKESNLEEIYKTFEKIFFEKPVYPNSQQRILKRNIYFATNPLISNPNWWLDKESEFKNIYGNSSRLFMLCIRKNDIGSDLVLADAFACASTPSGEKILQKKFLDLSYTYDKNGKGKKIVDMQYSPSNNAIINLTPSLRSIREIWSKFKSKKIKNMSNKTLTHIPGDFFNKVANNKVNSVSTNKNTKNTPITTMKNVVRLLKGLLKDEFGRNIKPVILQGRNESQLLQIIARNMLHQKNDNKDNEYQLIQFSNSDFDNSNAFRITLSRVLFSPPQTCYDEKSALELNLFTQVYQKPVSSKTFLNKIKLDSWGVGGLVKDFFSAIEPTGISSTIEELNKSILASKSEIGRKLLRLETAKQILETSHNLTHQQKLQELLIQKDFKFHATKKKTPPVENEHENKRLILTRNNLRQSKNSAADSARFGRLQNDRRGMVYGTFSADLGKSQNYKSWRTKESPFSQNFNTGFFGNSRMRSSLSGHAQKSANSSQNNILGRFVRRRHLSQSYNPQFFDHSAVLSGIGSSLPARALQPIHISQQNASQSLELEIKGSHFFKLLKSYVDEYKGNQDFDNACKILHKGYTAFGRDGQISIAVFYVSKGIIVLEILYDPKSKNFILNDYSEEESNVTGLPIKLRENKTDPIFYYAKSKDGSTYIFRNDIIITYKFFVYKTTTSQEQSFFLFKDNFFNFYEFPA
jgi:hypothetical protein